MDNVQKSDAAQLMPDASSFRPLSPSRVGVFSSSPFTRGWHPLSSNSECAKQTSCFSSQPAWRARRCRGCNPAWRPRLREPEHSLPGSSTLAAAVTPAMTASARDMSSATPSVASTRKSTSSAVKTHVSASYSPPMLKWKPGANSLHQVLCVGKTNKCCGDWVSVVQAASDFASLS